MFKLNKNLILNYKFPYVWNINSNFYFFFRWIRPYVCMKYTFTYIQQ